MLFGPEPGKKRWFTSRVLIQLLLLVIVSGLSLAALALPIAIRPSSYPLKVNEVSSQDVEAPGALSFTSEYLSEQARMDAADAIAPVYLPADPAIARKQIERLRVNLNYITTVRLDTYANLEQKIADMAAMQDIQIGEDLSRRVLLLTDARWQIVEQEALNVLEQIMRNTIREDQLESSRRGIATLISYSLPEDQAAIVTELVTPFVTANSLYSEQQTQSAREEARAAVEPVTRSFAAGEIIVRRGQVITPATWEVLTRYGLVQPPKDYPEIIAAAALVVLAAVFTALYMTRRHITALNHPKHLLTIGLTFVLFLFAARLLIPNRAIMPYLFPLAAFGLTVSTLISLEVGLILSLVLSILAGYGLANSLDLTIFYVLSSLCGILVLSRGKRVANFFWAGIAIGAAGSAVVVAYRLPDTYTDWIGIATLIGASFFNGLASASLTLLLQFLFSQILGLTTALQLLDLLRPDHPLLQLMLHNAPGSYQHSLQVSNLAEQAAEAIGADALLVRAGAIYHDCGKAANPLYFIENQVSTRVNPHDDLDPANSASTILHHIEDGLALARKYRLPPPVQDFIREHHGTMIARYQYAKALEAAGNDPEKVDKNQFRYPGPRPRSRETALLMLADGVEARARAEVPKSEEELRALIKKVFDYIQKEEQLEDTGLTFRDLSIARESFFKTLLNSYHPRLRYPEIRAGAADTRPDGDHPLEANPTLPLAPKQRAK